MSDTTVLVHFAQEADAVGCRAWEASLEEFERLASHCSLDQAATEVRNLKHGIRLACNRGFEFFYGIGRWLNFVRKNYTYGQWERFLKDCGFHKTKVSRYRALARMYTPESLKSCVNAIFEAEGHISLERLLGHVRKPKNLPAPQAALPAQPVDDTVAHPRLFPAPDEPTETDTDGGQASDGKRHRKPSPTKRNPAPMDDKPTPPGLVIPPQPIEDDEAKSGDDEAEPLEIFLDGKDMPTVDYVVYADPDEDGAANPFKITLPDLRQTCLAFLGREHVDSLISGLQAALTVAEAKPVPSVEANPMDETAEEGSSGNA